jgi:hypothetical protein
MSHLTKLLVFLILAFFPASAAALPKAAVFEFELIDSSLDGEILGTTEAEKSRLAQMAPRLRQLFTDLGIYEIADTASVAEQAKNSNLQACGFCDSMMAKKVGADLAVTGTVQKVSNLILNINIYVRNAQDNKLVNVGSVDIRGNNDDSWFRGLRYLVKNRMYKQK